MLGFASGVMVAASVWSLLIPAMEQCRDMGRLAFLPALVGFGLGIGFLFLADSILPHLHIHDDKPEGVASRLRKSTMMFIAVTLHNLPEASAGEHTNLVTLGFSAGFALMMVLDVALG